MVRAVYVFMFLIEVPCESSSFYVSLEVFIPTEGKSSTGALRQNCNFILEIYHRCVTIAPGTITPRQLPPGQLPPEIFPDWYL